VKADRLRLLREFVDEYATISGDITRIATNTWAVHGMIPVDGDVIMAEFDTYDEARAALDSISTQASFVTPAGVVAALSEGRGVAG
jgi:hypothetical protein